jgi:hypothetical protein
LQSQQSVRYFHHDELEESGIIKVKVMNIVFVLDSYDRESIERSEFFSAILQSLSNHYP